MKNSDLIESLEILPNPKKTYLEILEVHNKEVPIANLLAFFFRNQEAHNLNNSFIKALLKTKYYELDIKKNPLSKGSLISQIGATDEQNIILNSFTNVKVQTEVRTSKDSENNNKRIDILIDTDKFIICIEFKINHKLNNPLGTYREHIKNVYSCSDKKIFYIVLTPNKKEAEASNIKDYLEENKEFKQVILSHFFKNIEKEVPSKFKENNNYQYYDDFVQTIKNREIKSKRTSLLIKLNSYLKSDYHKNNKGGYLLINMPNYLYKIRINNKHYQLEKWSDKSNKESSVNITLDTDFEQIKNKIT